ncbi:sphingosine 1-phosphate receptor 5b isoform X1 [Danio rerio]|uniref:Sphingosine-1-phosphate receptor 5b n=2 Tax=Danio rerio TaxID=7955 RepID=A0PJS0_DANRE|nr:sphingosine 1-phosphate receptor 5b [Danio rerio]AAI27589.1 Zgc:158362 [Danio rerio]|eukprot:NP_001073124.1 sphingosine 1-phosphate receptor 5 [Danio rerio]
MDASGSSNSSSSPLCSSYQSNAVLQRHYNYTGKLERGRYRDGLQPEAVALLCVCLLIIAENLTVLLALRRNRRFHMPMFYLLGNLALSDLLAGVAYMLNVVLSGRNTLRLTPALWFLREAGVLVTLAASVLCLLAIAVERACTMRSSRPQQSSRRRRRMRALIGLSWALAVLLGALPVLGWNCLQELRWCSTVLPLFAKSYVLFCVSVLSGVLLAIVLLYTRIFLLVRAHTHAHTHTQRSRKHMALLRTVALVLGAFILCWTPLFALLLLDVSCPARACPILFKADYFLGVAMLNSLLNPVIYTLSSRDVRSAVLKLLCCRCTPDTHRHGLQNTLSSANATSIHKSIYPKLRLSVIT